MKASSSSPALSACELSPLEVFTIVMALLLLYGFVGQLDYEDAIRLECLERGNSTEVCDITTERQSGAPPADSGP